MTLAGFSVILVPPNSFLDALESYMSELAGSTPPFEVHLNQLQLIKTEIDHAETGILWLDVQETASLRELHIRLNQELATRFENTQAAFDGADYHFHMSIAIGGQPWEVYQRAFEELAATPDNLHIRCANLRSSFMMILQA